MISIFVRRGARSVPLEAGLGHRSTVTVNSGPDGGSCTLSAGEYEVVLDREDVDAVVRAAGYLPNMKPGAEDLWG